MRIVRFLAVLTFAVPLFAQSAAPKAAPQAAPAAKEAPKEVTTLTPDQLWSAMQQGDRFYVSGKVDYPNLVQERAAVRAHQNPPVTILACSDSRVPPELVFNQSLGALFVIRTAGSVADEFGIASIEFAIVQGYTKLIVVLGHEDCGAVIASLGVVDPGTPSLAALARRIRSSFAGIAYNSTDPENVRKAVEANTRASAAQLTAASAIIRQAVTTGKVKIVTAVYDMDTGEVKPLE
ncbi:MAG TPA: carbonic anhydrase [Thermoanaerobaculia bacterium]|jgi:carbonic anhydrase